MSGMKEDLSLYGNVSEYCDLSMTMAYINQQELNYANTAYSIANVGCSHLLHLFDHNN